MGRGTDQTAACGPVERKGRAGGRHQGYDGKTISQYVKANFNQGRLDFYNENPDRKRDASQRNVVANSQRQKQGNRKSKGASIA